jgi:hypothetical protein
MNFSHTIHDMTVKDNSESNRSKGYSQEWRDSYLSRRVGLTATTRQPQANRAAQVDVVVVWGRGRSGPQHSLFGT